MAIDLAYHALNTTAQHDQVAPFAFELFFGQNWGNGGSPYLPRLEKFLIDCFELNAVNPDRPSAVLTAVYAFAGYLYCSDQNGTDPVAEAVGLSNQAAVSLDDFANRAYPQLLNQIQNGGNNNRYGNNGQHRTYGNNGGYQQSQRGGNRFAAQGNGRTYGNQGGGNNFSNYGNQRGGVGGYARPNFNGTYARDYQPAPNLAAAAAAGEALIAQKREEHLRAKAERLGQSITPGNQVLQQAFSNVHSQLKADLTKANLGNTQAFKRTGTCEDFPSPETLNNPRARYEMVNEENITKPMGEIVTDDNNRWKLMEEEIGERVPEEWRNLPWDIRYFAPILYSFKTRKPYWTTKTICGIEYLSVAFKKVDEMNRADHEFPTFGASLDNAPAYDLTPAIEQMRDSLTHPERYQLEDLRKNHDDWKSIAAKAEEEWADWEKVNKDKPIEEQSEKPTPIPDAPEKVNFIAAKHPMMGYSLNTARNYMFSTSKSHLREDAINVMSCNFYSYDYIGNFMSTEIVDAINKAFTKIGGVNKSSNGKALTPVEFTRIIDAVVLKLASDETGVALDKMFTNVINEMLQYNLGLDVTIDSVVTDAEGNNDLVSLADNIREDKGNAYYQALGAFQWNLMNRLCVMGSGNEISAASAHYLGKLTNHSLVEIVANPLSINCRGITDEASRLAAVCDSEGQHLITEDSSPELFAILARFMPRYGENEFREIEIIVGNAQYKGYLNFLDGNRQTKSNANSFVLVAQ